MTFDDYLGLTREFWSDNYGSRKLKGVSLIPEVGEPLYLPMPEERHHREEEAYTAVEQNILTAIRNSSAALGTKQLHNAVKALGKCPHTTFYRALRKLREEKVIACRDGGFVLLPAARESDG